MNQETYWVWSGTREKEPEFDYWDDRQRWVVGNREYIIALCKTLEDARRIANALNVADALTTQEVRA